MLFRSGPCRVHYLLGPTPVVENGDLQATGSVFTRAEIDLKTQQVRTLDRSPTEDDELLVMWLPDGRNVRTVGVDLAEAAAVRGDVLADPGTALPAGATVLCRGTGTDDVWLFAGLIAGRATLRDGDGEHTYYVFAGVDRLRELLAQPAPHTVDMRPKYRTDDISILRPVPPGERAAAAPPAGTAPAAPTPAGTVPAGNLQDFFRALQNSQTAAGQPPPNTTAPTNPVQQPPR